MYLVIYKDLPYFYEKKCMVASGKKILVIDDEPRIRESIIDILNVSGYATSSANGGEEGLKLALSESPDLVLCDIMMPNMDGFEFLTYLKANKKTRDIPFIFLTAKAERQDLRKGMNLGADDYLLKPFVIDEVLHVIRTRINKRTDIEKKFESKIQALQEENKLKKGKIDELLFAISHDIKEPISKILSISKLISHQRQWDDQPTAELDDLIKYLEQNCQDLDQTVDIIDRLSDRQ